MTDTIITISLRDNAMNQKKQVTQELESKYLTLLACMFTVDYIHILIKYVDLIKYVWKKFQQCHYLKMQCNQKLLFNSIKY